MRIIKTSNSILYIGHQGENLATRVVFPAREWRTLFGDNGTFQLLAQRKGDENPYPVALTIDGENIYWDITSADTAIVGQGKCELQYYLGEILAKSEIWVTKTSEALGEAGEAPEPYQSWVDEVLEAGATAELSAIMARNSAEDAEDYAQSAQESADSITNMTVSAHSVPSSQEANVEKTIDPITGYVNLDFEIPRGSGGGGSDDFSVTVNGEQFLSVDGDVNIGTVLREHQSLSAYRTAADQDVIDSGKQDAITDLSEIRAGAALGSTAYQLPSDGIPKTDINPSVYASIPVIQATRDEESPYRFTATTSGLALATGTLVAIVFDNAVGTSSANVVFTDNILNTTTTAYLRLIDISGLGRAINPPSDWFLANRPYLFQYDGRVGENRYLISVTPQVTANVVQGTMDISQGGTGATTASQARDNLGVAEKPAVKTTMDSIATVNTQYYLGTQSAVTISLPTSADTGDLITCVFYSGATATVLTFTGATNRIGDGVVPSDNERVELNILYDGVNWAIVSNQQAVSA